MGLLPFPNVTAHRLMQDNDPKHTSGLAKDYLTNNGVTWWKTPPESPDLNPIENVSASLKRFLRDHHKPYNQATLIDGIQKFWKTLTPAVCTRTLIKWYLKWLRRPKWLLSGMVLPTIKKQPSLTGSFKSHHKTKDDFHIKCVIVTIIIVLYTGWTII